MTSWEYFHYFSIAPVKMQLFEKVIIQLYTLQYIVYMKKIVPILLLPLSAVLFLPSCKKSVDYYDYVSELRKEIYLYEEDGMSFQIHVSERETPFTADGIKGDVTPLVEVTYTPDVTPGEVTVSLGDYGGEMSYLAVSRSFYLSFTGQSFGTDKIAVTLTADGKEKSFEAVTVLYDGVISPREALSCVTEYDQKTFESLTENSHFNGEIYIRLLFDQSCFYYVGVCDRNGKINAYLVNGDDGRIIAEKKS